MSADSSGLSTLSEGDALALLATVPVGRLVYSDRALPFVAPVNFILDGPDVIIRTGRRSRLATHTPGNIVAFEVDEIDAVDRSGWSVVVTGRVQLIDDASEVARLAAWHLRLARPHPEVVRCSCRRRSSRRRGFRGTRFGGGVA
jgi:nitroimidazol reductase NimA-like FMN-containing flavoprotein (pyridoxamine 5'-phosphate oxidase superfamily)